MRRVRLTPAARRDLADIRRYTRGAWGNDQMRRYLAGMGDHFSRVANGDVVPRPADESQPGHRFTRYGSHFIFFRLGDEAVSIVRILHVRNDVVRHLTEPRDDRAD